MKTKKLNKKLTLNKKNIASLNNSNMNSIKGGYPTTYDNIGICYTLLCK